MNSTILVAESDASIRKLIKDILSSKGYLVETAGSLALASAFMARQEPDLIFAAFELDDGGGSDLLREATILGFEVPLILIVGAAMENPVDAVVRSGAMTYLNKPVDRARLEMLAHQGLGVKKHIVREMHRVRELSLSRNFMGALLDGGGESVFLLDAAGMVLDASGYGAGLFQASPETIAGKEYLTLLPSLSAGLQKDAIAKASSSKLQIGRAHV